MLTGSLSGFRGLPGAIGYGPSKAGLMALAESLRADCTAQESKYSWPIPALSAPHRIKVQLANPGFIKTRLTDKNSFAMPFIMSPEKAADHMLRHMETTRFQYSFPRLFSWVFRGSRFLPERLYFKIFGKS